MLMGGSSKNPWVLVLLILAGVVIGGFIGEYAGALPFMSWLKYGPGGFGLVTPMELDLGILYFQFGFTIKFTISGIIGIAFAIFIYRKWA